jgi:hypothetical protein
MADFFRKHSEWMTVIIDTREGLLEQGYLIVCSEIVILIYELKRIFYQT